jgi:hypothetical protein
MADFTTSAKRALCCLAFLLLTGLGAAAGFAQESGVVPLPMSRPPVDQLGQMEGVSGVDKTILAIGLFLQVIALVAVAIALAGHLSMPKKTPRQ